MRCLKIAIKRHLETRHGPLVLRRSDDLSTTLVFRKAKFTARKRILYDGAPRKNSSYIREGRSAVNNGIEVGIYGDNGTD